MSNYQFQVPVDIVDIRGCHAPGGLDAVRTLVSARFPCANRFPCFHLKSEPFPLFRGGPFLLQYVAQQIEHAFTLVRLFGP